MIKTRNIHQQDAGASRLLLFVRHNETAKTHVVNAPSFWSIKQLL